MPMKIGSSNLLWSALVVCFIGRSMLPPRVAQSQSPETVKSTIGLLKAKAAKLGPAEIRGEESVAGKKVPALFLGTTMMNNNNALVDEVKKEAGGTATIFVKSGAQFVRVATNVTKADGSRAVGTVLDPKGKVAAAVAGGESYYGDADVLGKAYITGYEPIRDAKNNVIGVYYVGYPKS